MSANNEGAGGTRQHVVKSVCERYNVYGDPYDQHRMVQKVNSPEECHTAKAIAFVAPMDAYNPETEREIAAPVHGLPGLNDRVGYSILWLLDGESLR